LLWQVAPARFALRALNEPSRKDREGKYATDYWHRDRDERDARDEARANLILNGSFELPEIGVATFELFNTGTQGIPSWEITSGDVDIVSDNLLGTNIVAQKGDQWLDLNGFQRGIIAQFFPTDIGRTYVLEFYYSDNPFSNANGSQTGVEKTGNFSIRDTSNALLIPLGAFSHSTATGNGADWTYSGRIAFVATTAQTRLAFSGDVDSLSTGVFIDDVSVTVPEPATLSLFALAVGGVMTRHARARRQRRLGIL
jgi:hypothetical protein